MRKTILTMAILTASAFVNAEYMIQIPLEKSGGGALPDGSIQIVKNDANPTNPAPEPAPETPAEPTPEPEAPLLTPEQACFTRANQANALIAANAVNATFTKLRLRPNADNGPQCEIEMSAPTSLYLGMCNEENRARTRAITDIVISHNFSLYINMYGGC